MQMQMQMANGVNNYNGNGNGMGFAPQQQAGSLQQTLELKAVAASLRPTDFGGYANSAMASQSQLFLHLPKEDAALLALVECFTFQYRNRGPNEMPVMPNASLYYTRLSAADSPLKNRMEEVVGFRCCACRHTTQPPSQYVVGSTQLICMEFFNAASAKKMLVDLKTHIFQCPLVPPHVKGSLVATTTVNTKHSSLEDYIAVWHTSLLAFAKRAGYPKFSGSSNNAANNNGQPQYQPAADLQIQNNIRN